MTRENKLEEYRFQLGQSIGELFEWEDIYIYSNSKSIQEKSKKAKK